MYTFNGNILTVDNKWLGDQKAPVLPPYTLMLKFREGITPTFSKGTGVQVSSSPNIWNLTYENTDWSNILSDQSDLLEVIEANTTGVTNMYGMFANCRSLTTVPAFDTSNVILMTIMFRNCWSLIMVPLFDTSSSVNMNSMFFNCYYVQSGALALYQQASSQAVPPGTHDATFRDCGTYTSTGTAELAQIPSDWK